MWHRALILAAVGSFLLCTSVVGLAQAPQPDDIAPIVSGIQRIPNVSLSVPNEGDFVVHLVYYLDGTTI
ncbi:MAG: hypothetical protein C4296_10985, partial [Gemmataceae bacterium]